MRPGSSERNVRRRLAWTSAQQQKKLCVHGIRARFLVARHLVSHAAPGQPVLSLDLIDSVVAVVSTWSLAIG